MTIPLPPPLHDLVAKAASLSLRFDRGYDGYDATWKHRRATRQGGKEGKTEFLNAFARKFNDHPKEPFDSFLDRRRKALAPMTAVEHRSTSAIIVGIGRWNPVEVGFSLDRFSGCPFLPGSSVKGLLRAAAELVANGDLEGDEAFWGSEKTRIFGEGTEEREATRSAFVFYDAFPSKWPTLEVDVMTPHHSKYYDGTNQTAPDWDEPVPVHFLRIRAGETFSFWFGPRPGAAAKDSDSAALNALLATALDWLGVGAKTSSGYGWFEEALQVPQTARKEPAQPAIAVWNDVTLEFKPGNGMVECKHGKSRAFAKLTEIAFDDDTLREKLKKRKMLGAVSITVLPEGNAFRIKSVTAGHS